MEAAEQAQWFTALSKALVGIHTFAKSWLRDSTHPRSIIGTKLENGHIKLFSFHQEEASVTADVNVTAGVILIFLRIVINKCKLHLTSQKVHSDLLLLFELLASQGPATDAELVPDSPRLTPLQHTVSGLLVSLSREEFERFNVR